MEEKVKDIYENIKDRLSNPLMFSFVLSWLVYNWEISVALFWYDKSQFQAEGCKSIFEFIQDKIDTKCCSTIFPLGIAFLYTFAFPYIKQGIRIFNQIALKWGDKTEVKYVKDGLTAEKINLQNKIDILGKKLDNTINYNVLNGEWRKDNHVNSGTGYGKTLRGDKILFKNGRCFIDNEINETYYITDFFQYYNSNKIIVVLEKIHNPNKVEPRDVFLTILEENGSNEKYSGTVNGYPISLSKIK